MGSAVGSCLALACLSAPLIGPSADGAAPEQVVLRLADRSWGLRIAPPGFEWGAAQSARNGTAVWTAGDADVPGLMARVVLYDMPDAVDADACLAALGARLDLASDAVGGVRRYRLGARPVIEYEVREHRGVEVNQRNLHGYLYHDRACAEVHVSFIGYQGQPHMLLERVITSVEIVATDGTDGGDSQ